MSFALTQQVGGHLQQAYLCPLLLQAHIRLCLHLGRNTTLHSDEQQYLPALVTSNNPYLCILLHQSRQTLHATGIQCKIRSATGMWPISNPFNPYRNQLWVLQCCIGPPSTLQKMHNIAACLRASRNPQSIGRGRHVRRPSVTALSKRQVNKLTNDAGLKGDRVRLVTLAQCTELPDMITTCCAPKGAGQRSHGFDMYAQTDVSQPAP